MTSVELRASEPGNGFGGAAADFGLGEQMAATEPGTPAGKPRSFGDQLDESLLESEADPGSPACVVCPAVQLPLLGALRAFGPPVALGGRPAEHVGDESAGEESAAGATESIASHPPVGTASAAAFPAAAPDTTVTPPSVDVSGARASAETAGPSVSAEAALAPESADTSVSPEPAGTADAPGSADTGRARGPSGAGVARDPADAAFVPASGERADGPQVRRDRAGGGEMPAETPARASIAPLAQEHSRDLGRPGEPAPVPAPRTGQAMTGPAERGAERNEADAREHRSMVDQRLPMMARADTTGIADPSLDAGFEGSASEHLADGPAIPRGQPSAGPSDGSRRQDGSDHPSTPTARNHGWGVVESPASADRTGAGRAQPSQPLLQVEPSPARDGSSRPTIDAGARMMPVGPPATAPLVIPAPVTAESLEVPRAAVAPDTADSIVQSMRLQYQRGGGEAVVHIKPEHLGPVSISLRVENGAVSAVVHAGSGEVAEWLKANEHVLRDGLASSGLHLERFVVRRDGHPPDRRPWRPPEPPDRRRRGLQPESTFEITV